MKVYGIIIHDSSLHFDPLVDACYPAPQTGPGLTLAHIPDLESSIDNHLRKLWLGWELTDRLDKVLVRRAIRRENGAEQRYYRERILVVYSTTGGEWLGGLATRALTG